VRIRLTDQGRRLKAKALVIPGCVLEASGLSVGDLRRLLGEILALRHALESYNPGAAKTAHG
jgi:MarR family transcriptional regulator, organic hydroperoxide resistance regulator